MLEPIYIVGPTAAGKSEVAAELAERIRGEIIGADAFQVYRGLDVLTAKPGPAIRTRVPHHLIGEIALTQNFDVEQYRRLASARIDEIARRGHVPVIVGGTGLYVRALTHGLASLPSGDEKLRAQFASQSFAELQQRLQELDPVGAAHIDLKNPRRVIRALEVCVLTGRPFSSFRSQTAPSAPVRGVLLGLERDVLRQRIVSRTHQMFSAGVIEEVRRVDKISMTAQEAIGFREIQGLIKGEIDESECRRRLTIQTQQYAKRQITWFRRSADWHTLKLNKDEPPVATALRVAEALGLSASPSA